MFGYFTLVNQLPTYMKNILHFNIKAVSCSFVLQAVVSFVDLTLPVRTRWRSWLRHCATSRKVASSIPDGVIGIFIDEILLAALWPWG